MFEYTGVDGIMIGRATMGNPWIFQEILCDDFIKPSYNEIYETLIKHLNLETAEKGEIVGIHEMRKHMSAYIKHMPHASQIRAEINRIDNLQELKDTLKMYFDSIIDEKK